MANRAFLLLDEPVSSLDIRHQLTIMRLARDFCERGGGVIAIMHDLNLTAMFADRMIMMKSGRVRAAGRPNEVMTDAIMEAVFGCAMRVNATPAGQRAFCPASHGARLAKRHPRWNQTLSCALRSRTPDTVMISHVGTTTRRV